MNNYSSPHAEERGIFELIPIIDVRRIRYD
jgi:hypothetical protein